MIKSFKCRETEKIYNRVYSKQLPHKIQKNALRKLWILDAVINLQDLRILLSSHLEKLSGKRKDQYSIRINKQWRVCFKWQLNNAYDVEITDYH